MALLLLFGGTPKEYIHLFAAHTDTVDRHHEHGEASFEPEHHHCEFLSFTLAPFAYDAVQYSFRPALPAYLVHDTYLSVETVLRDVPVSHLRGPPVYIG